MTMTAERLAELDAVMAKATLGHWHVFQCVQLEGDTLFQLEARVEPDTLQCVSTDIAGEDDAAAIVALHNVYPDLRAHIDAQAATIAGLRDALEAMIASRDANCMEREQYKEPCEGNEWHGYWSPHSSMIESKVVAAARAALTGAA